MKKKVGQDMYTYHVREMIFVSTCKRTSIKIAVYSAIVLIGLMLLLVPVMLSSKHLHHPRVKYPTDLKYVLFWTQPKKQLRNHFFFNKTEYMPGQKMFIDQNCPFINCYITYDKNILSHDEDYDAVVFDIEVVMKTDVNVLNFTRGSDQIYIFRSFEPPERYPVCDRDYDGFFNWTWTYKLNSDIPQPFFNIYGDKNEVIGPKKVMKWIEKMKHIGKPNNNIKNKNKAVAWIVTKCKLKTKHQDFINEFRNEISGYNYTLDIFGPCGENKCPNLEKCNKLIEKNYFFQLIIEEYLSDDYVTEHIVTAMAHDTIPIVVGAGDYRNFLPPGSYVNAQTFDLKKLGALIDYLIKNHDMYEYFFDWRNHYSYKESSKLQVCDLCQKLNEINKTTRFYKHFRYWWEPDYKDVCQRIRLYKIFNTDKM